MKKFFSILCAATALLVSCNKVETAVQDVENGVNTPGKVQVDIAVTREDDTKAIKTGWQKGDIIYVFFNNLSISSTPKYLKMTFDGNGWENTWNGDADADLLTSESGTMTAVYSPSGALSFSAGSGCYNVTTSDLRTYYMSCENANYTVSGGVVTGTLAMSLPEGYVQFFIEDETASGNTKYGLEVAHSTGSGDYLSVNSTSLSSVNAEGTISASSHDYDHYVLNDRLITGYAFNDGIKKGYMFSGVLQSTTSLQKIKRLYLHDKVTGVCHILVFDGSEITMSSHAAYALPPITSSRWLEGIDLGDGLIWATHNIGASTPSGTGSQFAWGELTPKSYYEWDNYSFATSYTYVSPTLPNLSSATFSKYNEDGKETLEAADDAATQLWGSPWRIPTHVEWSNIDCYNHSAFTQSETAGVVTITSSHTGNSLTLPAPGAYWSSDLKVGTTAGLEYVTAYGTYIYSDSVGSGYTSPRKDGHLIRPVFTKSK